jgi:glycine/D-amino acid oxidase-like deaminating enzyme
MNVDCLIIGQGICGTFLSWYLEQQGKSMLVIDDNHPNAASRVAAGLINPITGRRMVKTWLIDTLIPFCKEEYNRLGAELHINGITEKSIIDFFPTPQMKIAFEKKFSERPDYLSIPANQSAFKDHFNYDFGYGEISPCYIANLKDMLPAYRNRLRDKNQLLEEHFEPDDVIIEENNIAYRNISASTLFFCDGIESFNNRWFKNLPFAINKGEALIVRIANLPVTHVYKKGFTLIPIGEDLFWIGSSYDWDNLDENPTDDFKLKTKEHLSRWIKRPFEIIEHRAALRPATVERRPFAGFHPAYRNIGILNGMGTKGSSLGPYLAKQLVEQLVNNHPLEREADISRFGQLLSKSF